MFRKFVYIVCLVGLFLTACGSSSAPEDDAVAQMDTANVEASVTAAVMTAVAEIDNVTNTPVATTIPEETKESPIENTPTQPPPTEKPQATATEPSPTKTTAPTATKTPIPTMTVTVAPSCTTLAGINMRYGPGTVYGIKNSISAGKTLAPLSFSAKGYPDGQWTQVQIGTNGETGWVSASSQYMDCNVSVNGLPTASNIPATPAPPTPTPMPTSPPPSGVAYPNVNGSGSGRFIDDDFYLDSKFSNDYLLRIDIKNKTISGSENGEGIDKVKFEVRNGAGTVYTHEEGTAGYCIFRGGEPNCHSWPKNGNGNIIWGDGGPEVMPGDYQINVTIITDDGKIMNWQASFKVSS